MADNKTKKNRKSVRKFLDAVEPEHRRKDAWELCKLMESLTGEKPCLWGDSIVGFGDYHYEYQSGRKGEWFLSGFSPRKASLTLYIMAGFSLYDDLMDKLGKFKTGRSCLYVNRLNDIDRKVLRRLIKASVSQMRKLDKKNRGGR